MPFTRPIRCWLLAVMFCIALTGCTPKYVNLTKQGDILLKKEDYQGARRKYEAALKKNPKYSPALYKLGLMSAEVEKWDEVVLAMTNTIAADPLFADAYRARGLAQLYLGRVDAAATDFRKAKELGAKRADLGMGICAYLRDRYDDAFAALREALQVDADAPAAAEIVFKTAIASNELKTGRELLEGAKTPTDADDAGSLQRMRTDLAYLDRDFKAAQEFVSKPQDRLSFGLWYREPSPTYKKELGSMSGAIVEYVHLGSPAATAGIQASDIITGFERKPIRTAGQLEEAIDVYRSKMHHEEALIEVLRGNQQLAFRVMPGDFKTKTAIDQAAAGGDLVSLPMAPKENLQFP